MLESRFWILFILPEEDQGTLAYGVADTVGIVDEEQGGIILYCHKDSANMIVEALEAHNGDYS